MLHQTLKRMYKNCDVWDEYEGKCGEYTATVCQVKHHAQRKAFIRAVEDAGGEIKLDHMTSNGYYELTAQLPDDWSDHFYINDKVRVRVISHGHGLYQIYWYTLVPINDPELEKRVGGCAFKWERTNEGWETSKIRILECLKRCKQHNTIGGI